MQDEPPAPHDAWWVIHTARAWQTERLLAHYLGLSPADFAHKETL